MKNLLFFLLLGGLLVMGCSKDCEDFTNPACSNYDPCYGITPTSAEFEMREVYDVSSHSLPCPNTTDTFFVGSLISFEAVDKNAISYEWKIGNDDRTWTTSSLSLRFHAMDSTTLMAAPIQVRLIVKKEVKSCFAEDAGVDTLMKYIHFIRRYGNPSPIMGNWVCTQSDNPDEPYTIKIYRKYNGQGDLIIENFENQKHCPVIAERVAGGRECFASDNFDLIAISDDNCDRSAGTLPNVYQVSFYLTPSKDTLIGRWLQVRVIPGTMSQSRIWIDLVGIRE